MAAGTAKIGALNVSLGINSAQFQSGLKAAQGNLSNFGRVASVGFAAVAAAATAAGLAVAALGKKAIDSADQMSKVAQKAGLATEALSRLNYAAGYSDVSLEQLSGGLQKLARNMADIASGAGGTASVAFEALGIKVTEASGQLRASDAVFSEIADKFARLEDGSTKTALAMQLFGRTGADLIPLLNGGSASLKAMADESDRLGLTISTKTGRAAEKFNDTLAKVGRIVEGVALKIAEAALPSLQRLADMLASPEFAAAAQAFGSAVIEQLANIVQWIGRVQGDWEAFVDFMNRGGRKKVLPLGSNNIEDRSSQADLDRNRAMGGVLNGTFDELGGSSTYSSVGSMWQGMSGGNVPTFSDSGAAKAMADRLEALRQSLMTEEQLEMDSHLKRLEEIGRFYEQGAIKKAEYDSLTEAAQMQHSERMAALVKEEEDRKAAIRDAAIGGVASVFGSLSQLAESFGNKNLAAAKAFGVAEAVINTAQGITKAFTLPPPASWAQAAAVAAAGAVQIGTIMSAQKGSSSRPGINGGGGAALPTPAAPTTESQRAVNITFQGLGRSGMEQFVRELNDALGDGVKLNLNPA